MSAFFSGHRYKEFIQLVNDRIEPDDDLLEAIQTAFEQINPDPPIDYSITDQIETQFLINFSHLLTEITDENHDEIYEAIHSALRMSDLFKSSHHSSFFSGNRYREFIHLLDCTGTSITIDLLNKIKDTICLDNPDPPPDYSMNIAMKVQFLSNFHNLLVGEQPVICTPVIIAVLRALQTSSLFKPDNFDSPFFSSDRYLNLIQLINDQISLESTISSSEAELSRRIRVCFCTFANSGHLPIDYCLDDDKYHYLMAVIKSFFFDINNHYQLESVIKTALVESVIYVRSDSESDTDDSDEESESESDYDEEIKYIKAPCDCTCQCGCKLTKYSALQLIPLPSLCSDNFTYLDSKDKLDRFSCPICLHPAIDPIVTTCCGELQCLKCFNETVDKLGHVQPSCSGSKKVISCSKCKATINSSSVLRIPGGFKDYFDELSVKCLLCDHSCRRDKFQDHWSLCQLHNKI